MTLAEALSRAAARLAEAGIDDARVEAEVLLRHALQIDRGRLFRSLKDDIESGASCRFESLIERRLGHEPAAYITGHREFYGLDIEVSPAVLIPRPETEILVEAAIEAAGPRSRIRRGPVLADIGTGSGAVAIALALNVPRASVYGVDLWPEALALAQRNADRLGASDRVLFLRGDLFTPLPEFVDVVVANLPYVKTADWERLPPEIRDHEPRLALDGGADGLDLIRAFLAEASAFLRPKGVVCLEFGFGQGEAVTALARRSFPESRVEVRKDLAGIDRVLIVSPRG